jgi:hypothetical protein
VFYRIEQLFPVQHIDVEMLSPSTVSSWWK